MRKLEMLDLGAEYAYLKEDIDAALGRCLRHQRWIFGPEVKELEEKSAAYLGVSHCIGTSSGTEALALSLRALAIKTKGSEFFSREDEIITTPFTFTATGNAIVRAGATPVFVDIDPESFNIDPIRILQYLDGSDRVVGIVPVHLYGQTCDMDGIMKLAADYGLFVVEDTAQALGAEWRGKKLGALGDTGAFSFFPSKNLGGFGDGGLVSTDDSEIADLVRMLLKQGGKDKYNVEHVGYNARLDTIQAAVLLAKFPHLDAFNAKRVAAAETYNKALRDLGDILLPLPAGAFPRAHVYNQYTLKLRAGTRDRLQEFLKGRGIPTMVYYPMPLHRMKVFEELMKAGGELAVSEEMPGRVLSLPAGPFLGENDIDYITMGVRDFFSGDAG